MADYGIKIAKPGFDAKEFLTETNKKNFIIVDSADAHKIIFAGFVSTTYDHNLGYTPHFLAFQADSVPTASNFRPDNEGHADRNRITNLPARAYLIIFNEGDK